MDFRESSGIKITLSPTKIEALPLTYSIIYTHTPLHAHIPSHLRTHIHNHKPIEHWQTEMRKPFFAFYNFYCSCSGYNSHIYTYYIQHDYNVQLFKLFLPETQCLRTVTR